MLSIPKKPGWQLSGTLLPQELQRPSPQEKKKIKKYVSQDFINLGEKNNFQIPQHRPCFTSCAEKMIWGMPVSGTAEEAISPYNEDR